MKPQLSKNKHCQTLAEIKVGQKAKVVRLHIEGLTRYRLLDLGLLPATEVRAIMRGPLGDPTAYDIRGSILALRSEDASKIVVKTFSSDSNEGGS